MLPNSMGRQYAVYADCGDSGAPVEAYSAESQKGRLAAFASESVEMAKAAILDSGKTLPFFAEKYNISAKVSDYILVPMVMMPATLPNRNCVGFPFEELTAANADTGCLGFQTWKNKPTHIDHCFPGDAPIQTARGSKRIKRIKVGDSVFTHKRRLQKVTHLFDNGKKWLSEVSIIGLPENLYGTENHPLWVVDRRQFFERVVNDKRGVATRDQTENLAWEDVKPHWRPVTDTYAGDYLVVPVTIGGDVKVDPDFAFLTGVFMAEGCFAKYNGGANAVQLTIGIGEGEFRKAITSRLERLGLAYSEYFHKHNNTCLIVVRDRDFAERMMELCGDYAHKKRMKGLLREWNAKAIRWFLGGYISGDGCVRAWGNHKKLVCRTASRDLAFDLQQAFAFAGFPVGVNKDGKPTVTTYFCNKYNTERTIKSKGSYSVSAMDWQVYGISKYTVGKPIMENTDRERSWQKIHLMNGHLLLPIHSVKHKVRRERVYNIEVEEDHSYIAYGVAVHNCNKDYTKAKGIIFETAMRRLSGSRGDLWKVMCLAGFDRTRDPVLANAILTGERRAYSMGAWTSRFTCSICACEVNKQACDHITFKQPRMSVHASGQLSYLQARDITGFELSSVVMPAYASAVTDHIMTWDGA